MPTIIIQADQPGSDDVTHTLRERIVAANLDGHYVAQLIDRINWAVEDAEAVEESGERDASENRARMPA